METILTKYVMVFIYKPFSLEMKVPIKKFKVPGFPGGAVVENLPANPGDTG